MNFCNGWSYYNWVTKPEIYNPYIQTANNKSKMELFTSKSLAIKKIIFNDPATIIYWEDGTKTVVKCAKGDEYNKSAGVALCFMKRILGDSFHKELKKLVKEGKEYVKSDNK